jgi:hypothetical protein
MSTEKSAVEKFLEGTEPEQELFPQEESSFEENTQTEESVEEKPEKPVAFHKDLKIQKYLEKREREMEERLKASLPKQETQTEDEFKGVIESLTSVIGNDTPEKVKALNDLDRALKSIDERAVRRAEEKIQEIREREVQADREAEEELAAAFENIEETYDVDLSSNSQRAKTLRSEFSTFVERIAPKDKNGDITDYPDMISAWETFSEMKKSSAQPSRAKELAARSMDRSAGTATPQARKMDWKGVDEFMDSLK